jgi:hypothetical protein
VARLSSGRMYKIRTTLSGWSSTHFEHCSDPPRARELAEPVNSSFRGVEGSPGHRRTVTRQHKLTELVEFPQHNSKLAKFVREFCDVPVVGDEKGSEGV